MPITDLSTYIAGLNGGFTIPFAKSWGTLEAVGVRAGLFYVGAIPGAAVAPTPGLAGAALTSYGGQLPFPAAAGGENIHLNSLEAVNTASTLVLFLLDRLWHNSGIVVTTTTAQTVNSVAFPARDRNGLTDGTDVTVWIEVSTATTNAGAIANMTMSYTNEAGTSGRTATVASFPATAVAGTMVPFTLQAGDLGVRSIQSVTLGTSLVAGTVHLVATRQLAMLALPGANVPQSKGPWDLNLIRCYDNTVPFLSIAANATTAGGVVGSIGFAQN